jgi:hypothetical protein
MAFTRVSPRRRGAPAGSLTFTGHPGRNAVSFSGRVSRSAKRLAPGHYTLTVAATNSAGTTRSRALAFTVV